MSLLLPDEGWYIALINLCRADLDASRQSWGMCAPVAAAVVAQLLWLLLSKILLWINSHAVTLSLQFVWECLTYFGTQGVYLMGIWDSQGCLPQFITVTATLIAYPCKSRKWFHCASFPKKLKSLIVPVGWILLAKDKETPCKEARCATADFPS